MTFLVQAFDSPAPQGPERRQACRPEHLKLGKKLYAEGKWLWAAAILNEAGDPIGTIIICDFPSKEALQQEWLNREPYLVNKVWEKVEIHPIKPAPFMK